ncbi:MAG: dockerin type I domain-containing protein [Bacteroidales bacterium]
MFPEKYRIRRKYGYRLPGKIILIFLLFLSLRSHSQIVNNDLAMVSILSPVNYSPPYTLSNVVIEIRNNGVNAQSIFPVYFKLNGGQHTVSVVPMIILPGASLTYTFGDIIQLVPGCNTLEAGVNLVGDQNISNNSVTVTLVSGSSFNISTDTLYPSNASLSTGTTDSLSYTQNSLVEFSGAASRLGWMTFDLTNIPAGNSILSAELHMNVFAPFTTSSFSLKRAPVFPQVNTAGLTYEIIKTSPYLLHHNQSFTPGQNITLELPTVACWDIGQAGLSGQFSVGFQETSKDTTNIGTFSGWAQGNAKPYIIVQSNPALLFDVGVISIDIDTVNFVNNPVIPMVTIADFGLIPQLIFISVSGTGGYSSSLVSAIPGPGQLNQISFPSWVVPAGQVCFNVSIYTTQDENCLNNSASLCWNNILPPGIQGRVTYNNSSDTPIIDSTYVLLYPVNPPGLIMVDTVDAYGYYSFNNVPAGTFNLLVQSEKAWGGGNAVDALMALKHFIGLQILTGMAFEAADINANGVVNSLDALMIVERFMWIISSFPSSDWITEIPFVNMPQAVYTPVNLKIMCRGDVNGSFVPH